jgi:hypothetical protein
VAYERDWSEAEYKFEHFTRLRLLKRTLILGSGLGFVVINWSNVVEALQFLWSCYVSKRHDQPFNDIAEHYSFSVLEIGNTLMQFAFVMVGACFCHHMICLISPAEDKDQSRLEYLSRSAQKYYEQLKREAQLYKTAENILEQNMKLRAQLGPINDELMRMGDAMTKMRVEMSAIDAKRSSRRITKPKQVASPAPDLFEHTPCPPKPLTHTIKAKWRMGKPRRGAPKF